MHTRNPALGDTRQWLSEFIESETWSPRQQPQTTNLKDEIRVRIEFVGDDVPLSSGLAQLKIEDQQQAQDLLQRFSNPYSVPLKFEQLSQGQNPLDCIKSNFSDVSMLNSDGRTCRSGIWSLNTPYDNREGYKKYRF